MRAMTVDELAQWLTTNRVDGRLPMEIQLERKDQDGEAVIENVAVTGCELTCTAYNGAVRLEVEL